MLSQLPKAQGRAGWLSLDASRGDITTADHPIADDDDGQAGDLSELPAPPLAFPLGELAEIRGAAVESQAGAAPVSLAVQEHVSIPVQLGSIDQLRPSTDSYTLPPEYSELHPNSRPNPSDDRHESGYDLAGRLPSYPAVGLIEVSGNAMSGADLPAAHPAESEEKSSPSYHNLNSPRSIRRSHQPAHLALSSPAFRSGTTPDVSSTSVRDEKRKLDLEEVTSAIDRMMNAAPQLIDQRYTPRAGPCRSGYGRPTSSINDNLLLSASSSPDPKEKEGRPSPTQAIFNLARTGFSRDRSGGKDKDKVALAVGARSKDDATKDKVRGKKPESPSLEHEAELRKLWEQIEKAHGHRLNKQSFDADSAAQTSKALRKRESFFIDLLESAAAGRLQDQDAISPASNTRTAVDLLTMKEFVTDPKARAISHGGDESQTESPGAGHGQRNPMNRQRSSSLPVNKYAPRRADPGSAPPTPTSMMTIYDHDEESGHTQDDVDRIENLRLVPSRTSRSGSMVSSTGSPAVSTDRHARPGSAGPGGGSGGGVGIFKRLGLRRRGSSASVLSLASGTGDRGQTSAVGRS